MTAEQHTTAISEITEATAGRPVPRRFARKRMLALAGLATAALAIGGLTACEADEPKKDGSSSQEKTTDEGADDGGEEGDDEGGGDDRTLAGGETAAWDSGLKVTVSEPEAFTPDEWAAGHTEGNDSYTFGVTIENTGNEDVDADWLIFTARAGDDGVSAEQIHDSASGIGADMLGTVRPGQKATTTIAFDVPADAGSLSLEIEPGLDWDAKPAFWDFSF
ncbi:DUF4352 domain-containing protein [Streptomyces sp. ACA25]|uniref:DUF4352 domain-containing protein n=1 Tax=Streptomyces sp. ACA25 TaxID=3022596 RepID=UPI002306E7DF|nr:DUF4352 domain-containing protein [Streptomyces sp. ACA25]MDB1087220.1 DUF4352 domain-containing protein [Streptomyces sp. ACA25]